MNKVNVGTIGHVDHGKTTLAGALTSVLGAAKLPESSDALLDPIDGGNGCVRATLQTQQDQLADFAAKMGAPVPPEHADKMAPKPMEPPVMQQASSVDVPHSDLNPGEAFTGFELPAGGEYCMIVLHADPLVNNGEPPQLMARVDHVQWKEWIKHAVSYALTHGQVEDNDGTVMKGILVTVVDNEGKDRRFGLLFSQIAAFIPFKDVEDRMDAREQLNQQKHNAVALKKAKRRAANKRASKARKRK